VKKFNNHSIKVKGSAWTFEATARETSRVSISNWFVFIILLNYKSSIILNFQLKPFYNSLSIPPPANGLTQFKASSAMLFLSGLIRCTPGLVKITKKPLSVTSTSETLAIRTNIQILLIEPQTIAI
jgi:hypothetical protein